MSYKPISTFGPFTTALASDVVFALPGNAEGFDTYQLGSVTGAMAVFGSGDGVTVLATALGLTDLTTGLTVAVTAPGKHYGLRGRYKKIVILQSGATAVTLAYVIASEAA